MVYLLEKLLSHTGHWYGRSLVSELLSSQCESPSLHDYRGIDPRDLSCRLKCSVLVKRRWQTEHVRRTMVTPR